jgi:uncharacterized repeat protein (TIGR03803 family)
MKRALHLSLALFLCVSFEAATAATTKTITQLFSFPCPNQQFGSCPDGYRPNVLIQASDGNFYGTAQLTTTGFSSSDGGTVFKITPAGVFTLLFTFKHDSSGNYVNGDQPATSLLEGNDGFLYGATFTGGASSSGVVFKIGKDGKGFRVVHNFCSATNCSDGNLPSALILGQDGNLYGAAEFGGSNNVSCQGAGGCGTIFRITPAGTFATIFVFDGSSSIGEFPSDLIQGSDGNFYGTAGGGRVFRLTSGGKFTVLESFPPVNGFLPTNASSGLFQASNGKLYGALTTYSINQLQFYEINPSGSGFQEFPSFGTRTDTGGVPKLIQASDGNLWNAVPGVGGSGGSVLVMSPGNGSVVKSFSFTGANGSFPEASVVQGSDGKIYGTAILGGTVANGQQASGTVWSLNAGLPPPRAGIAAFAPASGSVGSTVTIRGNNFIGTKAVAFNGVSAAFKVLNVNFITATVPAGATSGSITVTNPGGMVVSSNHFIVQ